MSCAIKAIVIVLLTGMFGIPIQDASARDRQAGVQLLEKIVGVQKHNGRRAAYRYYEGLSRIEQARVQLVLKRLELKWKFQSGGHLSPKPPPRPRLQASGADQPVSSDQYSCFDARTVSLKAEGPWPFYADLFEIDQTVGWCGDGTVVLNPSCEGKVDEGIFPWTYLGAVSGPCYDVFNVQNQNQPTNSAKYSFEAHFAQCLDVSVDGSGIGGCYDHQTPYVAQQVGSTGDQYWEWKEY